jgi:hypothetical protein
MSQRRATHCRKRMHTPCNLTCTTLCIAICATCALYSMCIGLECTQGPNACLRPKRHKWWHTHLNALGNKLVNSLFGKNNTYMLPLPQVQMQAVGLALAQQEVKPAQGSSATTLCAHSMRHNRKQVCPSNLQETRQKQAKLGVRPQHSNSTTTYAYA